jgi:hypothetical protein
VSPPWYDGFRKQEGLMVSQIKRNRIAFRVSDHLAERVSVEASRAGMNVAALVHAAVVAHLETVNRSPEGSRNPVTPR